MSKPLQHAYCGGGVRRPRFACSGSTGDFPPDEPLGFDWRRSGAGSRERSGLNAACDSEFGGEAVRSRDSASGEELRRRSIRLSIVTISTGSVVAGRRDRAVIGNCRPPCAWHTGSVLPPLLLHHDAADRRSTASQASAIGCSKRITSVIMVSDRLKCASISLR